MPNKIDNSPPTNSVVNNNGISNRTIKKVKIQLIKRMISARVKEMVNTPETLNPQTHESQQNSQPTEEKKSVPTSGLELLAYVAISKNQIENQIENQRTLYDRSHNQNNSASKRKIEETSQTDIRSNKNEVITLNSVNKGRSSAAGTGILPESATRCNPPPKGSFKTTLTLDASVIQKNSIDILLMIVEHPFFIEHLNNANAMLVIEEFHHYWIKAMYSEFEKNKHRPSPKMEESLWFTMINKAISGTTRLESPGVRDNAGPVEQGADSKQSQSDNVEIPAPDSRQQLKEILTSYLKLLINFFTDPAACLHGPELSRCLRETALPSLFAATKAIDVGSGIFTSPPLSANTLRRQLSPAAAERHDQPDAGDPPGALQP